MDRRFFVPLCQAAQSKSWTQFAKRWTTFCFAPVAPTSAWQGTPRATWGTKIPALAFRGHLTSTLHVLAYCWRLITCSFLPVCFLRLVSANMRLIVTLYLCDDFFLYVPFFYFVLCLCECSSVCLRLSIVGRPFDVHYTENLQNGFRSFFHSSSPF